MTRKQTANGPSPVTEWAMWCVFLHGQPMLDTLSVHEFTAQRLCDKWRNPALDQLPEVRQLNVAVAQKKRRMT